MKRTLYADGSIVGGNPGGAIAWAVVDGENALLASGSSPPYVGASNNHAELLALHSAALSVPVGASSNITIFSDSKYVTVGINGRWRQQAKRGWLKADGTPAKNVHLIAPLYADYIARPGLRVEWIKGHQHPTHNLADEAARALAQSAWKAFQS